MAGRIGMILLVLFLVIYGIGQVSTIKFDPIVGAVVALGAAFFLFVGYVIPNRGE